MKESDRISNSERSPLHELSGAVRGKYAGQSPAGAPAAAAIRQSWAPLVDFPWTGTDRCVIDNTSIYGPSAYREYDAHVFDDSLSQGDRALCRDASHWLSISLPVHHPLSVRESMNSFLLALWIIQPTKTRIHLRFDESPDAPPEAFRVLDRFQWSGGYVRDVLTDDDLSAVSNLLSRVQRAYTDRKRLRNALVLTFRGCVSADWQGAFICWSAALEALLTDGRGPQLTDRLARAYAKLVDASGASGSEAVVYFKAMYDIRSDIVHGRSYERDASKGNLADLAACADLLRNVWRAGLNSEETYAILESEDQVRHTFFARG